MTELMVPKREAIRHEILEALPELAKKEVSKIEEQGALANALLAKALRKLEEYEKKQEELKKMIQESAIREALKKKVPHYTLHFKKPYPLKVVSTFLDKNQPFYYKAYGYDEKGNPVAVSKEYPYLAGIRLEKDEEGYWVLYFLLASEDDEIMKLPVMYVDSLYGTPIKTHMLDFGIIGVHLRPDGRPIPSQITIRQDISVETIKGATGEDIEIIQSKVENFQRLDDNDKLKAYLTLYEQMLYYRNELKKALALNERLMHECNLYKNILSGRGSLDELANALISKAIGVATDYAYDAAKYRTRYLTKEFEALALKDVVEELKKILANIKSLKEVETAEEKIEEFEKSVDELIKRAKAAKEEKEKGGETKPS